MIRDKKCVLFQSRNYQKLVVCQLFQKPHWPIVVISLHPHDILEKIFYQNWNILSNNPFMEDKTHEII